MAVGGFALAALLMVPLTLLAMIGGMVFGGWQAFAYVLGGALLAALLGFLAGRTLGHDLLRRHEASRLGRLSRQLVQRGTVAVAVLRLVPIAPFAVFNLVAGSSHLGLRQFLFPLLAELEPPS